MDDSYLAYANPIMFASMCLCAMCQMANQYTETYSERVRVREGNPPLWLVPPPDWSEWILLYSETRLLDSREWDGEHWWDVFLVTRIWTYERVDGDEFIADYEPAEYAPADYEPDSEAYIPI